MVERIVDLLRPYLSAPWGYLIVGAATFLENSVGAGVIVPGETLVIIGGFYARLDSLSLPWVAVAACTGAILGDNTGYLLGRRFGRGLLERHGRLLLVTPERLERADRYYRSHGGKTVFLGRFIPVVRSLGFILAGVTHMRWRRFFLYDLAGSVLWGVGHSILGYLLGASYERWKRYLTPGGIAVLVVLVGLILLARWRTRRRERSVPSGADGLSEEDRPEVPPPASR